MGSVGSLVQMVVREGSLVRPSNIVCPISTTLPYESVGSSMFIYCDMLVQSPSPRKMYVGSQWRI